MTKRTVGIVLLALTVISVGPAAAQSTETSNGLRATGLCMNLSAGEVRDDADGKIGDIRVAVTEVKDMRDSAQASGDVSRYQQLNNLYTQMNSRLLVAEQAREGQNGTDDRNSLESDCGLIDAAYTSVMSSRDQAERVVTGGVTGGDAENLVGGSDGLPNHDTTSRGRTISPDGSDDGRENSAFARGTPFS